MAIPAEPLRTIRSNEQAADNRCTTASTTLHANDAVWFPLPHLVDKNMAVSDKFLVVDNFTLLLQHSRPLLHRIVAAVRPCNPNCTLNELGLRSEITEIARSSTKVYECHRD